MRTCQSSEYAHYDRIDARQNLSLGEVRLDRALVGPRKAFAKCNRCKLNSLCSNTRSLSRCELQAAPPPRVSYACRYPCRLREELEVFCFDFFSAVLQDRREVPTATNTSGSPNGGREADLAIFPGIWTHSFFRLLFNA